MYKQDSMKLRKKSNTGSKKVGKSTNLQLLYKDGVDEETYNMRYTKVHHFASELCARLCQILRAFSGLSLLCWTSLASQCTNATVCTSPKDDSILWCNGTDEHCCTTGCCETVSSADVQRDKLYSYWYFWVALGIAFLLLLVSAVVCAIKCYRHNRNTLSWGDGDIAGAELYQTVQDARGLIRPFLAAKQPSINGTVLTHPYGALGESDGLTPLQPAYPPLRPPCEDSAASRRNSDHIASIIMPPGFVPQTESYAAS